MAAHRVVFSCVHGTAWVQRGLLLTHRDRNPLNNRLDNLRLVTPGESVGLMAGWPDRSLPRNVYANQGGYLAQVQSGGRTHSKWFKTLEKAAAFAAQMRERLFGIPAIQIAPVGLA